MQTIRNLTLPSDHGFHVALVQAFAGTVITFTAATAATAAVGVGFLASGGILMASIATDAALRNGRISTEIRNTLVAATTALTTAVSIIVIVTVFSTTPFIVPLALGLVGSVIVAVKLYDAFEAVNQPYDLHNLQRE